MFVRALVSLCFPRSFTASSFFSVFLFPLSYFFLSFRVSFIFLPFVIYFSVYFILLLFVPLRFILFPSIFLFIICFLSLSFLIYCCLFITLSAHGCHSCHNIAITYKCRQFQHAKCHCPMLKSAQETSPASCLPRSIRVHNLMNGPVLNYPVFYFFCTDDIGHRAG